MISTCWNTRGKSGEPRCCAQSALESTGCVPWKSAAISGHGSGSLWVRSEPPMWIFFQAIWAFLGMLSLLLQLTNPRLDVTFNRVEGKCSVAVFSERTGKTSRSLFIIFWLQVLLVFYQILLVLPTDCFPRNLNLSPFPEPTASRCHYHGQIAVTQDRASQTQHHWCLDLRNSLLWRACLDPIGSLATFLAFSYKVPVTSPCLSGPHWDSQLFPHTAKVHPSLAVTVTPSWLVDSQGTYL